MKLRKRKHNREGRLCVVSSDCVYALEVGGHNGIVCRQFSEHGSVAQENPQYVVGRLSTHIHINTKFCVTQGHIYKVFTVWVKERGDYRVSAVIF